MRLGLFAGVLLLAAPALADTQAGVDAWARGDDRKAVALWRGPALTGDMEAQYNLGQAYKLGRGVSADPAQAEAWFAKAAAQGHEQAGDEYALMLFQAGRKADALPWLQKGVERDEPRTELVYGAMLFNGDGVPRDYPRAWALVSRAAARAALQQMDSYVMASDREQGAALARRYAAAARPAAPTAGTHVAYQPPAAAPLPAPPGPSLPKAAPKPVTVAAVTPAERPVAVGTGEWRIQLGAFRDRGNADALWAKVGGRFPDAAPAFVGTDGITRLQATGFASKPAAQAACKRAAIPCNVVAP